MKMRHLAAGLAMGLCATAAVAQESLEEFFGSRTFEIHVGYGAGGGYDAYTRTLSRHIGKHLPGNPDVIVRNVPGAGSLVLMNQLANTTRNDGTVIGMVNSGMPFEPLFGNEQAQFDIDEMELIGNLDLAVTVGVVHERSGVERFEQLYDESITVGSTGAGSNTNTIPRVIAELFGVNINVVSGYSGSNEIVLAMERGEVDGLGSRFLSSLQASTPGWLEEDSEINFLYQLAAERHPLIPDVPLLTELAGDNTELRQAANLLGARLVMGRPIVGPPGIPQERLEAIVAAVRATTEDPEFLQDAENQGLSIGYASPEQMRAFYSDVYGSPQSVVEQVSNAMN